MDCVICKNGIARPGHVNVVLQRNACTIIIKDVPADVCENCGEYYLNEATTGVRFLRKPKQHFCRELKLRFCDMPLKAGFGDRESHAVFSDS